MKQKSSKIKQLHFVGLGLTCACLDKTAPLEVLASQQLSPMPIEPVMEPQMLGWVPMAGWRCLQDEQSYPRLSRLWEEPFVLIQGQPPSVVAESDSFELTPNISSQAKLLQLSSVRDWGGTTRPTHKEKNMEPHSKQHDVLFLAILSLMGDSSSESLKQYLPGFTGMARHEWLPSCHAKGLDFED